MGTNTARIIDISVTRNPDFQKANNEKGVKKSNKKKGVKSEVFAFEIDEIKAMTNYFETKNMYLHKLVFILSINMARRCGDMRNLKWLNFINPSTGNFRKEILEIVEDKTDKFANPLINKSCRDAISEYIEKTKLNVSNNGYNEYVFMQLSGTHKGSVLSESGELKALKKAAAAIGIEKNIGTHSLRKTFGYLSRMLHRGDVDSMQILQEIYNHSSENTTRRYIGLTKEKVNKYYSDMGDFFDKYISKNNDFAIESNSPIVSLDSNDLRDIIRTTYELGKNNAGNNDAMVHVDAINSIMQMVEELSK